MKVKIAFNEKDKKIIYKNVTHFNITSYYVEVGTEEKENIILHIHPLLLISEIEIIKQKQPIEESNVVVYKTSKEKQMEDLKEYLGNESATTTLNVSKK